MAKLSEKIRQLNQKGVQNLEAQGVVLLSNAKTSTIITSILEIVGNDDNEYKSIEFIDDSTLKLIDEENLSHEIKLELADDQIVNITYDGKTLDFQYNETGALEYFGETEINLGELPSSNNEPDYASISYEEDNTVTLLDNAGNEKKMTYAYEEGKITSLNYDDTVIDIQYNENGDLIKIGDTSIDLAILNLDSQPEAASTI